MLFGSHVSIRRGFLEAAKTARSLGGRAFQYFPKNPRSLALKTPDWRDAEACAAYCRQAGMQSIAHTAYLMNLAVGAGEYREKMVASLLNDLAIAEACGSLGVVVHFGIYKGGGDPLEGYRNIVATLNEVLSHWEGAALLLLENQSGEHAPMGKTLEELTSVRKLCARPEAIGFCLDTCHAFASGLWNGHNWDEVSDRGEALGYFAHLKAVHLNDSRYPFASCRDRHAGIGKGWIGEAAFRELLASPHLEGIPIVLETPGDEGAGHSGELALLREWVEEERN